MQFSPCPSIIRGNPNDAKKPDKADMGKPFGKASGRTFIRNGTPLPLTNWNSPKVKFSDHIKISKRPPFEALKGGLPMSGMEL
jgi:hypothetical protein